MKATLIAHSIFLNELAEQATEEAWSYPDDTEGRYVKGSDALGEFAGRACYQSWNRPNPRTATNQGYLANILVQEHYSVLEHATATFYITGVSRALSLQLAQHVFISTSELSQRYVDAKDFECVIHPTIEGDPFLETAIIDSFRAGVIDYIDMVDALEAKGITGKQAREAARVLLPSSTETKIVATGNLRAWRDFLSQRLSGGADREIRMLAHAILLDLKKIAPNSFMDF